MEENEREKIGHVCHGRDHASFLILVRLMVHRDRKDDATSKDEPSNYHVADSAEYRWESL
jgi:hypothetical protein